jgi:hypothetical protein
MAESVRSVEYFSTTVEDASGAVQKVLSTLKDNGVNLLAFLGFPAGDGRSQIDLVPEDPAKLRAAAQQAGLQLSEARRALMIEGDDRVGAVAEITSKLADAGVNITATAAVGAGPGRFGMIIWVGPVDYDRAAKALGA